MLQRKSPKVLELEARYGLPLDQILMQKLAENDYSISAVARALGNLNQKTVWNWCAAYRIKVAKFAKIA